MQDSLRHYGIARRSGRYPWGSGDNPYQGGDTLTARIDAFRRKGFSEKDAAAAVGMSIAEVREQRSLERSNARAYDVAFATALRDKGMGFSAIAERMGKNESSVRSLLDPVIQERAQITKTTAEMLRNAVGKEAYVQIGVGVEAHLGISKSKLSTSVRALENEGYEVINIQVDQLGTDRKTTVKVLAPPGTTYRDVVMNKDRIRLPSDRTEDGGRSFIGMKPPVSVSSERLVVAYKEDGGADKDGLIELRRGVEDLTLGTARYAQVRIAVDGTHYLKGMALISDDLPKGVDIRFNTNKPKGTPLGKTLKTMDDDDDNPFGSSIKQFTYTDASGKKRQSPINIVGSDGSPNVEGRWAEWNRSLSSQMLSKQPAQLAKEQLGLEYQKKRAEFDEVNALTNPVIKKRLLISLADDCDASANHLQAAALPRLMNHVILPIPTMPDHQVYAPNYKNGEKVVLIRHPHGGKFEIPELTVNNSHREAKRVLGNAKDAIGISPAVANRMSGADFDGDTVLVIPNRHGKVQTSAPLVGLKDFDPIAAYPAVPGMKVMGSKNGGNKQTAMGDISNLITDMTIKGANPSEIARAVRHSMVVIDSVKHELNYTLSAERNGIKQLKEKYQGKSTGGASTLVSRARSDERIPHRKEGAVVGPVSARTGKPTRLYIDPKTGEKLYTPTGESWLDKKGRVVERKSVVTKMEAEKDAHKLSSGTTIEGVYADYANSLKSLGNSARKASLQVKSTPMSTAAKTTYAKEVASLKTKLTAAVANAPLERQAQLVANDIAATKREANKDMSRDDIRKLNGRALTEARARVGANKPAIVITPREWMAIQKGAVSNSVLEQIVANADLDAVRALATPRPTTTISRANAAKARSMQANGYSLAEIAAQLGISASTVRSLL